MVTKTRERGELTCKECGKRIKWVEESRGSFGMLKRYHHARMGGSFVGSSGITPAEVASRFHSPFGIFGGQ